MKEEGVGLKAQLLFQGQEHRESIGGSDQLPQVGSRSRSLPLGLSWAPRNIDQHMWITHEHFHLLGLKTAGWRCVCVCVCVFCKIHLVVFSACPSDQSALRRKPWAWPKLCGLEDMTSTLWDGTSLEKRDLHTCLDRVDGMVQWIQLLVFGQGNWPYCYYSQPGNRQATFK